MVIFEETDLGVFLLDMLKCSPEFLHCVELLDIGDTVEQMAQFLLGFDFQREPDFKDFLPAILDKYGFDMSACTECPFQHEFLRLFHFAFYTKQTLLHKNGGVFDRELYPTEPQLKTLFTNFKHRYTRKLARAWDEFCSEIKEIEAHNSHASETNSQLGEKMAAKTPPMRTVKVHTGDEDDKQAAGSLSHAFVPSSNPHLKDAPAKKPSAKDKDPDHSDGSSSSSSSDDDSSVGSMCSRFSRASLKSSGGSAAVRLRTPPGPVPGSGSAGGTAPRPPGRGSGQCG